MDNFNTIYKDRDISYKLLPNMEYVVDSITANQEDFGSFMLSASKFFSSKIDALRGIFNLNGKVNTQELSKGTKALLKELESNDKLVDKIANEPGSKYLTLSKVLIPYIPGVAVDHYMLVTGIKPYALSISNDVIGILEELDTYISKLVGDQDFRTSLTPAKELTDKLTKIQSDMNKYLLEIIDGKIMKDHRELKDVIPNLSSVKVCHNTLKEIIGVRDFEKLAKLQELSNRLAGRANELYKLVNGSKVAISKTRLKEFKDMLPVGAKLIIDATTIARLVDGALRVQRSLLIKLS